MSEEFPVHQEGDRVARAKIVAIGVIAAVVFTVAVVIAQVLPRGTATGRSFGPRPPRAPRELGIVEQTLFEQGARGYELNAEQREELRHYGWIDKDSGVARIPIDRAMDLIVEKAGK